MNQEKHPLALVWRETNEIIKELCKIELLYRPIKYLVTDKSVERIEENLPTNIQEYVNVLEERLKHLREKEYKFYQDLQEKTPPIEFYLDDL